MGDNFFRGEWTPSIYKVRKITIKIKVEIGTNILVGDKLYIKKTVAYERADNRKSNVHALTGIEKLREYTFRKVFNTYTL